MSAPSRYSATQIALHWLTAALVIAAFASSDAMEDAFESRLEGAVGGPPLHAWFGIAALVTVLTRLALRYRLGAPSPAAAFSGARAAAVWGHRLLYALLVIVPLGGMATWLTVMEGSPHGFLGQALLVLALGHAIVALVHHFLLKDDTLRRITRPGA